MLREKGKEKTSRGGKRGERAGTLSSFEQLGHRPPHKDGVKNR